jgi:hypothetical protein
MSIDERLRGLQVQSDEPGPELLLLDRIAERAQARQRRSRSVAVVAAAAALAIVAAAPIWWSRSNSDGQPVHPPPPAPTTTTPTTSPPTEGSSGEPQSAPPRPVEAPGWESVAATERVWLRSFVDTEDEAQAQQVYRAAQFEGLPLTLELQHGLAAVRIGHNGSPDAPPVLTLLGTYRVEGRLLVLRLDEVGISRYRWDVETSGRVDTTRRLTLTYLSSTGPPQFGAPPEVLLRLFLTASTFTYHQGF